MTTLYIRLPSKAAAGNGLPGTGLECRYALASDGGAVERDGVAVLDELGDAIGKARKVVLLLAASDVSLLQTQVPPMSPAKLKAALPSLVEEQLMSDPAACILVAGPAKDGMRTIAAVERDWLTKIVQHVQGLGAGSVVALPQQLCLPLQPDSVSAAFTESTISLDVELVVRSGEQEGLGLALLPVQPDAAAREGVQALCALAPFHEVALYVAQERMPAWQAEIDAAGEDTRITLHADNWRHWIAGAGSVPFNLAAGLGASGGTGLNLQAWRWPLALAALLLLVNIIGLNVEWLRLKGEAADLRASMTQAFRSAYPKEPLTGDPALQMRRNIAQARQRIGLAAPDDFLALSSAFGEIWQAAMQERAATGIASIEYNERTLQVTLKPEGEVPADQIEAALAARNLTMVRKNATVWQIRSGK